MKLIIISIMFALILAIGASAVIIGEEWQVNYTGSGSGNDRGYDIDINNGVVAVAGYAVNAAHGASGFDFLVIKYNTDGDVSWIRNFTGSATDKGYGVAVDSSSNIYVTGSSYNTAGNLFDDMLTIKYDSSGNEVWKVNYSGVDYDEGWDVAVDSSGNVYVTGLSYDAAGTGDEDILTIKYNSAGVVQWMANYTGSGYDIGNGVYADSSGSVYVAGYSENAAGTANGDIILIKYNSAGVQQWIANYTGSGEDEAFGVVTDSSGNVYVTGYSNNAASGSSANDLFVIKYDSLGNQQWAVNYTGSGADEGYDIDVDSNGNLYIAGWSTNAASGSSGQDIFVVRYNSTGSVDWQKNYTGTGTDRGQGIKFDSGSVYATGYSNNAASGSSGEDIFTIKYNQSYSLTAPSDTLTAELAMNGSIDGNLSISASYGTDQNVTFVNESTGRRFLKVGALFSAGDVDFTSLAIQESGVKVAVDASGASGIDSSYTIYLPNTLSEGVYVCPNADTVAQVSLECSSMTSFTFAQCVAGTTQGLVTCSIDGSDYALSGMTGSGAGEGNPDLSVPEFSEWAMIIALLGGFLGISVIRKRK